MHGIWMAFALAAWSQGVSATVPSLKGIDVYRSAVLSSVQASRRFGERLQRYIALRGRQDARAQAEAEALRSGMAREAADLPGIVRVELTISDYYTAQDHSWYVVFDVVDRADAPARLAFAPAPREHRADPDGLLVLWSRYAAQGEERSRRGELTSERPSCPGFFCLWDGTAEAQADHARFVEGAARRGDALRRVLAADASAEKRAAALFVLSYSSSGALVGNLCRAALSDRDARVRGAALQILADIANIHPEIPIDMESVLARLDDPALAVRVRTMGVLVPLAGRDEERAKLLPASTRLAALLRMRQPESGDLAFTLLRMLSGKSYQRFDFASWEAWAASAAQL